jgi:hypothetical protein
LFVTAVFDLDTNTTYLAQYRNCGTNLVSVNSAPTISTLSGICNLTQAATATGSSGSGGSSADANGNSLGASAGTRLAIAPSGSWLALFVGLMLAALL